MKNFLILTSILLLKIAFFSTLSATYFSGEYELAEGENSGYEYSFDSCGVSQGVETRCAPGFVCVGSTNTLEGASGTCEPDSTTITICRFINYIGGNDASLSMMTSLLQKFTLFAFVVLAVAFFVGKVSWGMIITLITGLMLIFGSERIADIIIGGNDSWGGTKYCSQINSKSIGTKCFYTDISKISNTNEISINNKNELNVGAKNYCGSTTGLDCLLHQCSGYFIQTPSNQQIKQVDNEGVEYDVTITTYKCSYSTGGDNYFFFKKGSVISTALETFVRDSCSKTFNVDGSPAMPTTSHSEFPIPPRTDNQQSVQALASDYATKCRQSFFNSSYDYFTCRNECTRQTFQVKHPVGKYSTCNSIYNP